MRIKNHKLQELFSQGWNILEIYYMYKELEKLKEKRDNKANVILKNQENKNEL